VAWEAKDTFINSTNTPGLSQGVWSGSLSAVIKEAAFAPLLSYGYLEVICGLQRPTQRISLPKCMASLPASHKEGKTAMFRTQLAKRGQFVD